MNEGISSFALLRNKSILEILDGSTEFGEISISGKPSIRSALPYLSGPMICELSSMFGLPAAYSWSGGGLSRWQYMDNLVEYSVKGGKCSELLSYLMAKERFASVLKGYDSDTIESAYHTIIQKSIDAINGILYFGGNELVITGKNFIIRKIGAKIQVETPQIKMIDNAYVKSISARAMQDIEQGNYDSAITKSRTLLEEVFCYVIEQKCDVPSSSGNMADLYKQVKQHYNMHVARDADIRIKMLLSGLEKIVSAISEMRNKDSDAHGVGAARLTIEDYHARLLVNSSMTMADFILAVANKANL